MRRRLIVVVVAILGAVIGLTGCQDDAEPSYPSGAIRLRQNIPTQVSGYQLIAVNIFGTNGAVLVSGPVGAGSSATATGSSAAPTSGPTKLDVVKGQHYQVGELGFEVLDVVQDDSSDGPPGSSQSRIVIIQH